MKKIILIFLYISTFAKGQVKLFQIEKSAAAGSVLTTTGTPGTLTYTNTLPVGVIPNLPAYTPTISGGYIPYIGASSFTTANNITANAFAIASGSLTAYHGLISGKYLIGTTSVTDIGFLTSNANWSLILNKTNGYAAFNIAVPTSTAQVAIHGGAGTNILEVLNNTGSTTWMSIKTSNGLMALNSSFTATGSVTSPTIYGSSSASGILNLLGTSSATAGVVNISQATGTTNVLGVSNFSAAVSSAAGITNTGIVTTTSLTVGSTAQSNSLVNFILTKNTGTLQIGEYQTGRAAIWLNLAPSAVTNANWAISADGSGNTLLNGSAGVNIDIAGSKYFGYSANNFDIGSGQAGPVNITCGSTNGTKLGTATSNKLGFWNATPVVQPTTAGAAATLVSNAGTALTSTDTFDGYTLLQIVRALKTIGLIQ